jgi:hypothetical protein
MDRSIRRFRATTIFEPTAEGSATTGPGAFCASAGRNNTTEPTTDAGFRDHH